MRPKLIVILLLLVLLPLALLAWLGVRTARNEQEIVQSGFRNLLTDKLNDVDATISDVIERRELELSGLAEGLSIDPAAARALVRKTSGVSQMFLLDPKRRRLHPPLDGPLNAAERSFLERATQVWEDKHVFYEQASAEWGYQQSSVRSRRPAYRTRGWYSWYLGSGINFIYWQRDPAGNVIGFELNRTSLLADIVSALPHADAAGAVLPGGLIRLVNARGAVLHQWGDYEPAEDERAITTLSLSQPLSAWELRYFGGRAEFDEALGGGVVVNFLSGLFVVAAALVVLAVYFYRESSREMHEARQRVSFVNQVSHELKTPLTNIRMYAELLEQRLDGEDGKVGQHLGVIVSESQRLSRLISNVLTFARQQRNKVSLRFADRSVDEIVRSVLDAFRPSLESKGVEIVLSEGAGETVKVDPDVLGQILGNLFGNVEKYAASGGLMSVTTAHDGESTTITVADKGPGIPHRLRAAVFDPFCRGSNKLTDGATGAGIGLAIARDLARLHGGDVTLDPTEEGASFRVVLHTPHSERGEPT